MMLRARRRIRILLLPTMLTVCPALAQTHHHDGAPPRSRQSANATCPPNTLGCATAATPVFSADGSVFVAFTAGNVVSVARSKDFGKTFEKAVPLAAPAPRMDSGADARASIVIDGKGRIVVAYAVFKDARFNAEVLIATSQDGGMTFSAPRSIGPNPASQRFPVLAVDTRRGDVFAAWLDKRNVPTARDARDALPASLAFGWSRDGGASFSSASIARDGTCECCRIGLAMIDGERPAMMFRNVFAGGVRDHALIAFSDGVRPGPLARVAMDDWQTNTCPHHGPTLAVGPDRVMHVAWFTEGRHREGLFYARSVDEGKTFSLPTPIGDADRAPTRPALAAIGQHVRLAWKEFDGKQTTVRTMLSRDAGVTWSAPRTIAVSNGYSDHPLLVAQGTRMLLSWLSHPEGYRLIPMEER